MRDLVDPYTEGHTGHECRPMRTPGHRTWILEETRTRSPAQLEDLERLRRGDESAFDSIFHAHYAALVGLAESILQDRAIAEEVVQDVMLELWRRRGTLTVQESLRGYLFRATRNRALNHLRHLKVVRDAEPRLASPGSAPPRALAMLVDEEIEVAVRAAVAALPARCRAVFELSRVHGLSYAEIATTLGISIKTVENQMGRALRELRARLASWL